MKIIELLKKHDWFWLLYAAVLLAVVLPWFFSSGYLLFTDFVWGPHLRLNWGDAPIWKNIVLWFFGLFLPSSVVQKLYLTGILAIVLLGGRKIATSILKDRWLVLLVSLFTLVNPFVYDRLGYGQINVVAGFGFLCLSLGYLLDYSRRGWSQLALAGLFAGMGIRMSQHYIFMCALVFGLVFVATVIKKRTWKTIGHFALMAAVAAALNAVWVVKNFVIEPEQKNRTQSVVSNISQQDLVAFQTSGDNGLDATLNVVLMSGFWGKDQYRYADLTKVDSGWGRSFIVLLPFLLWGIYVGLKKRESRHLTICLLAAYVLSVLLAVGVRLPVAREATFWLFDNMPFYKGMRETQKWVSVVVAIYAIFLSLGLRELFRIKFIEHNQKASKLFLAGVIIMQAPLLLWGLGGQVRPTEYPEDWLLADQRIVELGGCEGNTLFLPWHLYMKFSWTDQVISSPAKAFFTCKTIKGDNMEWGNIRDYDRSPISKAVLDWGRAFGETDFLISNEYNIKYILLAKELDWRYFEWLTEHPTVELIEDWPTLRLFKVNDFSGVE